MPIDALSERLRASGGVLEAFDVPHRTADTNILVRVRPGVYLGGAVIDQDRVAEIALHPGDEAELSVDQAAYLLEIDAVEVIHRG